MAGCGLLALQGPKAAAVLERHAPGVDFPSFGFMTGRELEVASSTRDGPLTLPSQSGDARCPALGSTGGS